MDRPQPSCSLVMSLSTFGSATTFIHAVYGYIPRDLASMAGDHVQCSPLIPGAKRLEELAPGSAASFVVHAPASTIERRAVIGLALRALVPGGALTVLAANDKGGTRLANELAAFGCEVAASHKRHHRIMVTARPNTPSGMDDAITAGAPRILPDLGLWSQPGLFNWDRIDPGSQVLLDHLPPLAGRGADLGCGIGVLALGAIAGGACQSMTLIDIDARALAVAERNVWAFGATTLWTDVRSSNVLPTGLDFVITNPPFHDGGAEDRALGQAFIQKAAAMLRPGGVLWLTANRHLPYEETLVSLFTSVDQIAQAQGFKIYCARKETIAAKVAGRKVAR